MKKHPEIGKRIIEGISFLEGAIPIIFSHHEKFNGSGYPQGASGQEIPIEARIFSVVDAIDAMISDRPYRKAMPLSKAKEIIADGAGNHFDPEVVEALCRIPEDRLAEIKSGYMGD